MRGFRQCVDFSGLTVLDPFVGGGTSVVEAARFGALGVDIDPVVCAITRFELTAAEVPDLNSALRGGLRRQLPCSNRQARLLSGGFTQAAADFEPATIARPAIVDGALARLAHPALEGDADGVGSFRPATRPQVKAPSRLHNR